MDMFELLDQSFILLFVLKNTFECGKHIPRTRYIYALWLRNLFVCLSFIQIKWFERKINIQYLNGIKLFMKIQLNRKECFRINSQVKFRRWVQMLKDKNKTITNLWPVVRLLISLLYWNAIGTMWRAYGKCVCVPTTIQSEREVDKYDIWKWLEENVPCDWRSYCNAIGLKMASHDFLLHNHYHKIGCRSTSTSRLNVALLHMKIL